MTKGKKKDNNLSTEISIANANNKIIGIVYKNKP